MRKIYRLSFIGPRKPLGSGLDFGPSFPLQQARVPSLASLDWRTATGKLVRIGTSVFLIGLDTFACNVMYCTVLYVLDGDRVVSHPTGASRVTHRPIERTDRFANRLGARTATASAAPSLSRSFRLRFTALESHVRASRINLQATDQYPHSAHRVKSESPGPNICDDPS